MKHRPLRDIDPDDFSKALRSESDRACAVLGAAFLDAKLKDVCVRGFAAFHEELLGNEQPLGAFAAKIRLASSLGWICEVARVDLDTIRGIRNDFAHSFDHDLSFSDTSISDRCKNLQIAQAYIKGLDSPDCAFRQNHSADVVDSIKELFLPARARFQLSVEFLAQYLDQVNVTQADYTGPDLLGEVTALSTNMKPQIRGTATVLPSNDGDNAMSSSSDESNDDR